MSFGKAIERRRTVHGTAAWLRIVLVALLIALALPALALADDAGTAVAEPPAAGAAPAAEPATEAAPGQPAAEEPLAEQPTPAPPAAEQPPAEPVPAAEAPEAAPAEPPAATPGPAVTSQPVVTPPVAEIPVELPALPEIALPVAPPASSGEPVPAEAPTAAPELPEATPGTEPAPPVSALPSLTTTPAEPPALHLVAMDPAPAAPIPPTPGVADALGIPNSAPAVTIGPPQTPGFAALLADLRADKELLADASGRDGSTGLFDPASRGAGLAGSVTGGAAEATQAVMDIVMAAEDSSFGFTAEMAVPVGPAPAGSSLLAVLAGYVLPGSSGPPASTLVMLIVIGLILGVGYAARPQLTEALASARLLGASSGHGMAVRRPG